MDIGLGGNVFARDYVKYEYLAKHSWFKHLWHLCHMFKCELSIDFRRSCSSKGRVTAP